MSRALIHDTPCADCGVHKYRNHRGLCEPCYLKRRTAGSELPPPLHRTMTWYLTQAKRGPDECWPWPGYITEDGYGRRSHGTHYGETLGHRIAYRHWVGDIPDEMTLDHTCHTNDPTCFDGPRCPHRACVNPAHLEPVTGVENTQRGHRIAVLQCPKGHPLEGGNLRIHGGRRVCATCRTERRKADYRKRVLREGRKPYRRTATHCVRGHELNEANLYVAARGSKSCRTCQREGQQKKRRAAGAAESHPGFCRQGHPMSGENLYVSPGGQRQCRACIKRRQAAKAR